jgi:hypothetical protein
MIIYLLMILFLIYVCRKYYSRSTYIANSPIHAKGLFSNKTFYKNDIILDDIFPNKPKDRALYKPITKDEFYNYISLEGTTINHCIKDTNSDVVTDDYKIYKLVATKDILPNQEIKSDYNKVNKRYPFIASAGKDFKEC